MIIDLLSSMAANRHQGNWFLERLSFLWILRSITLASHIVSEAVERHRRHAFHDLSRLLSCWRRARASLSVCDVYFYKVFMQQPEMHQYWTLMSLTWKNLNTHAGWEIAYSHILVRNEAWSESYSRDLTARLQWKTYFSWSWVWNRHTIAPRNSGVSPIFLPYSFLTSQHKWTNFSLAFEHSCKQNRIAMLPFAFLTSHKCKSSDWKIARTSFGEDSLYYTFFALGILQILLSFTISLQTKFLAELPSSRL